MKPFRDKTPKRTCKSTYKNYRSYKQHLQKDFGSFCGYCADADTFSGGKNFFHIDHFRPLNHFGGLECDYSNLVYACSYCNIAKSDDWPCLGTVECYSKGKGYIDPCDADFENHFERYDDGKICPKTDVGKYMYDQLKLGLRRHELIWLQSKIYAKMIEVKELYNLHKKSNSAAANDLAHKHIQLFDEYSEFKSLYEATL